MRLMLAACTFALLAACKGQAPADNMAGKADGAAAANIAAAGVDAKAPLGMPADAATARKRIREREDAMEKIGKATKIAGRELKGTTPDLAAVRAAAATIAQSSKNLAALFPPGSGPDAGKTRALPAIWQKPQDFAAKATGFEQAASAFDAAARSGDVAQIKARFDALGKTCKACHDSYRAKEKD